MVEGEEERLRAIHAEEKEHAEKCFTQCTELIGKIKAKEIMTASDQPKEADEVQNQCDTAVAQRKEIRVERLEKFAQAAEREKAIQEKTLALLEANEATEEKMLILLDRIVSVLENK